MSFQTLVVPLQEKLLGLGHLAMDKLGEAMEASDDPDFALASADKVLHRLGFAPKSAPLGMPGTTTNNTQVNNYVVDKGQLKELREKRLRAITVEGDVKSLPGNE